ncbi:MAG: CotH kinase family protein [Bacteroidetes bacterium]|nr:CotH kinase family protein [Bacteroidota bacterium]
MKKSLLIVFLLTVIINLGIKGQVVINEYSCANVSSFTDNYGGYEDWVELYNTTASPVSLNGWYMSDKKTNPTKWKITTATIPANGFLRVWASGRNISTGTLHAGFKLTQCKPEAIVLANTTGVIIDSLTLKPNLEGHSRGRTTNGANTWSVFMNPTPNASNASPYTEYATRPIMSIAAGFYAIAQSLTITSPDPGVTIRYTIDGSTPTAASTLYTMPINISTTKVVRAKAFSSIPNVPASFIESNTFFINASHTTEVVSIYGDQILPLLNGTQSSPYTGIEYFDNTGTFKTESYGNANKHGNDSWSYPQRGIDFVSHDEYGYNYALVDQIFNSKTRTEFQHIIFKAAANDNYPFETPGSTYAWGPNTQLGAVHLRDSYVMTLSQKANLHMDARTWAPCILYVNGQYWGVYDTREKVDDGDYTDYYYNTPADSLQMLKTWGGTWSEYGGAQAQTDWNALSAFITGNNMAIPANYNYVDSLYSVKSLADYVILNSFCVTSDWLNWNTIWWRGINSNANKKKWRYDLWDEDATFNHYINYTGIPSTNPNADPCDPQTLGNPGGEGHVPILNALLMNPTFNQYYIMRYFDLLNGPLKCSRMIDILDSMVNVIQPEMQGQVNKWGGSYSDWWANVQTLKTFIQDRCNQVVQQFDDCYPVTGPFPIKVNVSPPGAGTVDLNSLNLTSFVWSGQYPGNLPILMTAHPNTSYCFDYWEFQNHTPIPGINDTSISVSLHTSDSIVAHFSSGTSTPIASAAMSSFCVGDSTTLSVNTGGTFIWSPATGLSCTTCANPVASPIITTTYTVSVTGTCSSGTASVTITVNQPSTLPPTITVTNPTICIGDSTVLQSSSASTYLWSPATGLSCTNCQNPIATPTVTTTYTVSVTGSCSQGTASAIVTINEPSVSNPTITTLFPTICIGDSTQLEVTNSNTYLWSPAASLSCTTCANPVATPNVTTVYSVSVTGNCTTGTAEFTINIAPPPILTNSENQEICIPNSVQLTASGASYYSWTPSTGLSCTNCPSPIASPLENTTYIIVGSNGPGAGCKDTASLTVSITNDCPEIYIPNGFSPNGDNNNDVYFIYGTIAKFELVIYNRWGQEIFKTNDQTIGWDGTYKGEKLQSGVYAYKVSLTDYKGIVTLKTGNITLMR